MSHEPDFEASADMRLLELQREQLGLPPRRLSSWESRISSEGSEIPPEAPIEQHGAILALEAVASPDRGVIPGAVVTVSLSISNEGTESARDVVVAAPLPGGATYRPGSLLQDGRPVYDEIAEQFFAEGIHIPEIAPRTRATFDWKTSVRLGSKPLVIRPVARAQRAAILGARPVTIERKEQTTSAFAAELSRADAALYEPRPLIPVEIPVTGLPVYELDEEEQLVHEAAEAALSSAAPRETIAPEIVVSEPVAIEADPAVAEPEPEPAPVPVSQPAREAVMLYGRFDRATLAFFQRIFNGSKPPTILQHCIFGSALTCTLDVDGNDAAGLKRHLDAQAQVLHRITLHEKLGKKEPIVDYAGTLLADLAALQPAPVREPNAAPRDALLFEAELSEPQLAVLRKIAGERDRWDFVKARQLTLALQAQRLGKATGNDPAIESALRVYGQTATTALQKLFVRIRIDRSTGILSHGEPQLDAAAVALIAALEKAFE